MIEQEYRRQSDELSETGNNAVNAPSNAFILVNVAVTCILLGLLAIMPFYKWIKSGIVLACPEAGNLLTVYLNTGGFFVGASTLLIVLICIACIRLFANRLTLEESSLSLWSCVVSGWGLTILLWTIAYAVKMTAIIKETRLLYASNIPFVAMALALLVIISSTFLSIKAGKRDLVFMCFGMGFLLGLVIVTINFGMDEFGIRCLS